ncbi:MAG: dihydrodipicolinate synthase family protein [Salinibacter sp.]
MSTRLPSGLLCASLTPFRPDSSIAIEPLADHVRWLLENGCDGVLLFGTVGEGLSLTVEERTDGLHHLLEWGLPAERLLVGTGALPLPDVAQLTETVTQEQVGGVLVMPPFHYRQIPDEGVFRFYDQLVQKVGREELRLYFYHYPKLSGVPIPFDTIQRLQNTYPAQIAGIKDSEGEWDHTEALCRDFPDLQVFSGQERLLLPVLRAGGAGGISALANLAAPLAGQVLSEWRAEEAPEQAHDQLTRLRSAFAPVPTIAALKHVLAQRKADPTWTPVRPPLAPLDPDDEERVNEIASRLPNSGDLPGRAA